MIPFEGYIHSSLTATLQWRDGIQMMQTVPLPAPSWGVGLRPILVPWDSLVTVDEHLLGSAAVAAAHGPPAWMGLLSECAHLSLNAVTGVCKDMDPVFISTEGKVLTEPALHPTLH